MAGFQSLTALDSVYFDSGENILSSFLLPVLEKSVTYDRVTGYFNLDALLAVSHGLDGLLRRGGKMRLAVGIHDFPKDAAQAVLEADTMVDRIAAIREDLVAGIANLGDSLEKDRLATVALLIEDGFLQVKAADTASGKGIFHSKVLIMEDDAGESIAAIGSVNETKSGLGENIENLVVLRSWAEGASVQKQQEIFEQAWSGKYPGLIVQDLTKELAQDIVDGLGAEYVSQVRLRLKLRASVADAVEMPSYFFVSGVIPALYQHQERAVLDALSRWPVRVLFADEVGLGKTFEVASTLTYLIKFCGAKSAVILTPKSVLAQWQEELHDHFGIDAWLYDSGKSRFVSPQGSERYVDSNCPLGKNAPRIVLMSAQYARGSNAKNDVFSRPGTVLPDILAVDEAHAARVSIDISGNQKATQLYQTIKRVSDKIPHLVLATATPMQKDAVEYHSLLKLLGLPKFWDKEKAFQLSLDIVSSPEALSLNAVGQAAKLLIQIVKDMNPSLRVLTKAERSLLESFHEHDSVFTLGTNALKRWNVFQSLFIKLHPARLLTVRNTRRSLEEVGYVFPKRRLKAETLYGHQAVTMFYQDVEHYIGSTYLGVEKILYPDRVFSDGFVKSGYQQRMASSLYACGKTLRRRRQHLETLRKLVKEKDRSQWLIASDLESEDEDEALLSGKEWEEYGPVLAEVDASQVLLALNTEIADISSLESNLDKIRSDGDPKIDTSVDLAIGFINKGDQVLVFSRYTDTVEALVSRWQKVASTDISYGVYTGAGALLIREGNASATTKEEIKRLLNASELKVMFCSDAASEGLNLQAARVLINVDVPWTPARLEQRIGRVARLGQKAQSVDIVNVWFPDSVEQRMYARIDSRLKKYNLAVGEFPEVVSEAIRRSVMDGSTDTSDELLQQIRTSLQTEALRELWAQSEAPVTASHQFRQAIVDELASNAKALRVNQTTISVELADGSSEVVTYDEGNDETVSLSSKCVQEHFPYISGFMTALDTDGKKCAFVHNGKPLDPEKLPDLLRDQTNFEALELNGQPRWLPNPLDMSMRYAVEYESHAPNCWPPITEES